MAMPEATPIKITKRATPILEKYVRTGKAQARLTLRAEIILLATSGDGNHAIGNKLGKYNSTVRQGRNKWADSYHELQKCVRGNPHEGISDFELDRKMLEMLTDEPRSGTPPVITKEQQEPIRAMAGQKPEESGYPHTPWSHRLLAKAVVREKILDDISPVDVGLILKKMQSGLTKPNTGSSRK